MRFSSRRASRIRRRFGTNPASHKPARRPRQGCPRIQTGPLTASPKDKVDRDDHDDDTSGH
ncbi:MAG: hypothetical protein H6684_11385 [Deltaproteobacteria bacterium]|nr:hypothetical protein [Deltaproteobacteria bacterium]MCB9478341.1 hypothetical protein [Deltaproteobacteria bacterium]MCB9489325.1 hypothetical protein [Deltaproteobacteria bacterium]